MVSQVFSIDRGQQRSVARMERVSGSWLGQCAISSDSPRLAALVELNL